MLTNAVKRAISEMRETWRNLLGQTEVAGTSLHPETESPTKAGWYECWATDDRWGGEMRYRAWGKGFWWIPLKSGWLSSRDGLYRWRGPVADVNGPAPDGTNP